MKEIPAYWSPMGFCTECEEQLYVQDRNDICNLCYRRCHQLPCGGLVPDFKRGWNAPLFACRSCLETD